MKNVRRGDDDDNDGGESPVLSVILTLSAQLDWTSSKCCLNLRYSFLLLLSNGVRRRWRWPLSEPDGKKQHEKLITVFSSAEAAEARRLLCEYIIATRNFDNYRYNNLKASNQSIELICPAKDQLKESKTGEL